MAKAKWKQCRCCGSQYLPSVTSHADWCAACASATEQRRDEIFEARLDRLAAEAAIEEDNHG